MTETDASRPAGPDRKAAGNSTTPITDATYPRGNPRRKPAQARPRKPVTTTVGELLDPSSAAALVALAKSLEQGRKPRRRRSPS